MSGQRFFYFPPFFYKFPSIQPILFVLLDIGHHTDLFLLHLIFLIEGGLNFCVLEGSGLMYFSDPSGVFYDLRGALERWEGGSFSGGVEHFVHAASVLYLFLNFNRFDVRRFVLIFYLIHLVLKKLVIVALLIIDYAGYQQHCL